MQKQNKNLERSNELLEKKRKEAEEAKELVKSSMYHLTQEVEFMLKQANKSEVLIEELKKARERLEQKSMQAEDKTNKQKGEVEKKKQEITGLKDERQELKNEIDKYLKKISELEKECEKYGQAASKANANLYQVIEELKLKKNLIAELKKENIEFHAKLKQQ